MPARSIAYPLMADRDPSIPRDPQTGPHALAAHFGARVLELLRQGRDVAATARLAASYAFLAEPSLRLQAAAPIGVRRAARLPLTEAMANAVIARVTDKQHALRADQSRRDAIARAEAAANVAERLEVLATQPSTPAGRAEQAIQIVDAILAIYRGSLARTAVH